MKLVLSQLILAQAKAQVKAHLRVQAKAQVKAHPRVQAKAQVKAHLRAPTQVGKYVYLYLFIKTIDLL